MKNKALLIDTNNHAWRTWKISVVDVASNGKEALAPYREALAVFEPSEWRVDNKDFMSACSDMLRYGRIIVNRFFRYKFLNDLYFLIAKHRPTEIVLAIDDRGKNWRHKIYKDYKAKRDYSPDIMFGSGPIPEVCDPETGMLMDGSGECNNLTPNDMFTVYKEMVVELSKNFPNIKIMVCRDIEGDDIIATYVNSFSNIVECVIVSNDKDFPQLLSRPNVKIWNQHKREFVKIKDPEKYLLVKILVGDKSDNINNVCRGIGEKTALKYIDCVEGAKGKYLDGLEGLFKNNEGAHDNFMLNKRLIDMSMIPQEITDTILDKYSSLDGRIDKRIDSRGWLKYIQSKKLMGLVDQHKSFISLMKDVR